MRFSLIFLVVNDKKQSRVWGWKYGVVHTNYLWIREIFFVQINDKKKFKIFYDEKKLYINWTIRCEVLQNNTQKKNKLTDFIWFQRKFLFICLLLMENLIQFQIFIL